MTRPGSETPAPPPDDDAGVPAATAPAAAAISPSDPRLQRCAFAVLRGKGIHELDDGRQVNEFFVRTFDVSLGRRSRGGGADVVISGTKREWERERDKEKGRKERRGEREKTKKKKTHAEADVEGKKKKRQTSPFLSLLTLQRPSSFRTKTRRR